MLVRDTGVPASQHLGIKDEVAALNFNLAVSYRLFLLREEERKDMGYQLAKATWGDGNNADSP